MLRLEDVVRACGDVIRDTGREYVGPCPICGGTDRFHAREEDGKLLMGCRDKCSFEDLTKEIRRVNGGATAGRRQSRGRAALPEDRWTAEQLTGKHGEPTVYVWSLWRDGRWRTSHEQKRWDRATGGKIIKTQSGVRNAGATVIAPTAVGAGEGFVVFVEGGRAREAAIDKLDTGAVVALPSESAKPDAATLKALVEGKRVYLWPDNDEKGRQCMDRLVAHVQAAGALATLVVDPEKLGIRQAKGDAVEWMPCVSPGRMEQLDGASIEQKTVGQLYTMTLRERLEMEKSTGESLARGLFYGGKPGIAYSQAGGGKTTLIAAAVARMTRGEEFLGEPTSAQRVLVICPDDPGTWEKALVAGEADIDLVRLEREMDELVKGDVLEAVVRDLRADAVVIDSLGVWARARGRTWTGRRRRGRSSTPCAPWRGRPGAGCSSCTTPARATSRRCGTARRSWTPWTT